MPSAVCPACGNHLELLTSLSAENWELRQHNEILAREISSLRSQLDAQEILLPCRSA